MILRSTTHIAGLATMLNEFASACYDHGILASHEGTMQIEPCDIISISSGGETVPLTGFDAFDEDVGEREVVARIEGMLRQGATLIAGSSSISIGVGLPFVRASRPTRDVLIVETGGVHAARLMIIVDRSRGIIDTGRLAA